MALGICAGVLLAAPCPRWPSAADGKLPAGDLSDCYINGLQVQGAGQHCMTITQPAERPILPGGVRLPGYLTYQPASRFWAF